MRLFYSPFHDFVHKVRVVIAEAGLEGRVEYVASFPFRNLDGAWVSGQYDTTALNPLGKVPFLTLDDGTVLYSSPVVAEFLDSLGARPLFPGAGPARFDALRRLALGDAMFDFAVQLSMEGWRDEAERRDDLYRWLWPKIERSCDTLEAELPGWDAFDIGQAGVLQGLSYVDAWAAGRDDIPHNACRNWRGRWPALARWFDATLCRESVRGHYRQPFAGDLSPENHRAAVAAVLEARNG